MSNLFDRFSVPIARLFLGLIFFVFGLNGFFGFLPAPPDVPEPALAFAGALVASGYFFPVLKGTEVICGVLLLSGRAVPLALTVLAPITVNIFLFHAFLSPGLTMSLLIIGAQLFLAFSYRDSFQGVLRWKAAPAPRAAEPRALVDHPVG